MPAAAVAAADSVTLDSGEVFRVFEPKLDRAPDAAYADESELFSDPVCVELDTKLGYNTEFRELHAHLRLYILNW